MKRFSIATIAICALLVAATSCSKNSNEPGAGEEDGKTGKLSISFSLPGGAPITRAITPSTAKPVTSWANITRAMILFVDPTTQIVKDARAATLPSSGNTDTNNTYTGVVANATGYEVYIVGNYPATWIVGSMKGRNLASLSFAAPTAADYATSVHFDTGSTGYGEVEDVFVAKQSNIIINADANNVHTTPFVLARINALFRVRIDVNTKAASTRNDKVSFTASSAMFSIRRAATGYQFTGTTTYPMVGNPAATSPGTYSFANATKALNVFYKETPMKDAAPTAATHENPGTILTSGVTLWNEYKIFPAGSSDTGLGSGLNKFDIVLSAETTDGTYIPTGHTAPVAAGTRVYWSGQVQSAVGPNQILELNIPLETAGTTTLPPVGAYGSINITVSIAQWGDIISSTLPM